MTDVRSKKANHGWIWTAVDWSRGEIIDFERSGTEETFLRLQGRLNRRYDVLIFGRTGGPIYVANLPRKQHVISKAETCLIESFNSSLWDMPLLTK
jgi:IS1 family transposase